MRIVSFGSMNDASSWFRSYMWMDALKSLGNDTFYDASDPAWKPEDIEQAAKTADVVIFGRTSDPRFFAALQICRDLYHCKIIVDVDDLVTELSRDHPAGTMYHDASGARRLAHAIYRQADAVTVSTPRLLGHVSQINPYCYHIPNSVSVAAWEKVRWRAKEKRHREDIRIYWGGGGGHYGDLLMVRDAMLQVARDNPRVKLIFGNFVPDWAVKGLSCKQVFFIPHVEFHGYYKPLAWLCADVAVAPIEENEHNLCKSDVKYLDYAMAGIPGIYQRCEPYDAVTDGVTGLKAGTSDEWYECLKRLVEEEGLRQRIAAAAKQDVLANRTVEQGVHRYQAMLLEVAGRKLVESQFEMLQEGVSVKAV